MTRPEICGRLKDIELLRLKGDKSHTLIFEKLGLEKKLAEKSYDVVPVIKSVHQQRIVRKPPPEFFVDTYEGPRCDYCSGAAPNGNCINNDGMLWPHPPQ